MFFSGNLPLPGGAFTVSLYAHRRHYYEKVFSYNVDLNYLWQSTEIVSIHLTCHERVQSLFKSITIESNFLEKMDNQTIYFKTDKNNQ